MTALHSTSNLPVPLQVKVRIDNAVRLNVAQLQHTHRAMLERVKQDLVLTNPEWVKLKRLGKKAWGVPEKIQLYEFDRVTKDLVLPRGYLRQLLEHMAEANAEWEVDDGTVQGAQVEFPCLPELRDYQEGPVRRALNLAYGVVEAPTGGGKTICGLAVIGRLGRKAVWLTHTVDLAKQVMSEAQKHLGLSGNQLGMIGDNQRSVGTHLTVALVQTLVRHPNPLTDWPGLEDVGIVVLDECHHCPAETFQAVVATSPARYRIGLTATPKRADGMEPVLYAVIGPTLARVTNQQLVASGQVLRPVIHPVRTGLAFEYPANAEYDEPRPKGSPKLPPKHARYNRLTSEIIRSEIRNRLICDLVRKEYEQGHSCLVLSPFISHLETLHDMLSVWCGDSDKIRLLTGQHALPAQRARVLEQARQREVRIILATQLADEGLDVPVLDRLFLAMPKRAASKAVQQVGRIMRPAKGKVNAVVFDFVDLTGILLSQWKGRRKAYLDRGFDVREMVSASNGSIPTQMEVPR